MATAITPLANITLGSSASTVTFSSISGSYRDLMLVVTGTTGSLNENLYMRFNDDSGSNYYFVFMRGNGSATSSGTNDTLIGGAASIIFASYGTFSNSTVGTNQVHIMDYSATDKHKTVLTRFNSADTNTGSVAARWANTAAVTKVLCFPNSTTFSAGTTLALYGVSA